MIMKKFILFLLFLLFMSPSFCEVEFEINERGYLSTETLIQQFGEEILEKNSLPSKVIFELSAQNNTINQDMRNIYYENKIEIFSETLDYAQNEEEMKAVLSHKIAAIADNYSDYKTIQEDDDWTFSMDEPNRTYGIGKNYSFERLKAGKKDFEIDMKGVDLMVCAGINPLSFISVLYQVKMNVVSPTLKENALNRMVAIYDYINYNFPSIIEKGYSSDFYEKAFSEINKVISSRSKEESLKISKKQEKIRTKKINAAKRAQKYHNSWNTSYCVLKIFK